MSQQATTMAGDPWPWPGLVPDIYNRTPWWPTSWDAPSDPKVLQVSLIGQEEHYTIGAFVYMWDARKAAARALLAYRRWCRENLDDMLRPRGLNLSAEIVSLKVDQYVAPWWEQP